MWVIESTHYKNGGVVQYEKYYRLKHFSSGLYLSIARPSSTYVAPPKKKKDPYEIIK